MSCETKDTAGLSAPITAVIARVPSLPGAWFLELEGQFTWVGFTTVATRCNRALMGLNEESDTLVADILGKRFYAALKVQVIRRLTVSETVKLKHLLQDLMLRDCIPSQLHHFIQQHKVGADLLFFIKLTY